MKLIPWFLIGLFCIPLRFSYKLSPQQGFFGMVGPNLKLTEIRNLVELFTGNGVIQGVFFKSGTPQFVRHVIDTRKHQREPITREPMMITVLKYILYKVGAFPYNNIGVANTALYPLSDRVDENTTAMYAMYERDLPYLLHLYHNTSSIATIRQMDGLYPLIQEVSGHSKSITGNRMETLDYHVLSKQVDYYQIYDNMKSIVLKKTMRMLYLPIIHDFISTEKSIMIMDSPLGFDFSNILRGKLPIVFREHVSTFVHVMDKITGMVEKYEINRGHYVFHYALCNEIKDIIEIYAPLYDNLDFSSLNIEGKYRKIVINRHTKNITIEYNEELENMNLDFPIKGPDGTVILRSIENRRMNGFVMVNRLTITKTWLYDDLSFCGEHVVSDDKIMAFCIKNDSNYLCVIDMNTHAIELIDCQYDLTMGFHSVFVGR
jgi:carotenoid cleavage dioxygenase-like enzyme